MTESRRPKDKDTHIGNHKLDPSTLMMGYGFDPALSEGSLKPPIFLTSTFVFQTAAEGKRFFEGITNKHGSGGKAEGLVYSRFNGPNQEILEDRLKIWEDAEAALTFSSGMTAIAIPNASFPPEQQARLGQALTDAGVRHTIEIYPTAKHGFAVNGHIAYDRAAAELHWQRLVDLLKETL